MSPEWGCGVTRNAELCIRKKLGNHNAGIKESAFVTKALKYNDSLRVKS